LRLILPFSLEYHSNSGRILEHGEEFLKNQKVLFMIDPSFTRNRAERTALVPGSPLQVTAGNFSQSHLVPGEYLIPGEYLTVGEHRAPGNRGISRKIDD